MAQEIRIFVSHSPDSSDLLWKHPCIEHIIAGSVYQTKPLPQRMLRDDSGDHISNKNRSYCELTTQYWAWKNADADYYGFCHYRRIFSFSEKQLRESDSGSVIRPAFNRSLFRELGFDKAAMSDKITSKDMIVAKGIPVSALQAKDLIEHYRKARSLRVEDLYAMLEVIRQKAPELYEPAQAYLHGKIFYPCNMFIARKNVFKEYSEMLFSILEETEKRIDMENYSREGRRTMGHLGERFLGIYYEYLKEKKARQSIEINRGCRLGQQQMVLVENTKREVRPKRQKREMTVVVAVNEWFVPILSVTLRSVRDHCGQKGSYHIYVLHQDITETSRQRLCRELETKRFQVDFINVSSRLSGYRLEGKAHITAETYYRFLILDLFKEHERVLYLDCDMIIRRDLAELFSIDMGDNWIGAVPDIDFIGQCNGANPDTGQYSKTVLQLKEPLRYFQAGLLIFNIAKLREHFQVKKLLEMAEDPKYMYSDQDILNVLCAGHVQYLPLRWNVLTDSRRRIEKAIAFAPAQLFDEYEKARKDPWVIHFAGADKPWINPEGDFADEFWKAARESDYYEVLLSRMSGRHEGQNTVGEKIIDGLRRTAKTILPEGSELRRQVGALYWRFK